MDNSDNPRLPLRPEHLEKESHEDEDPGLCPAASEAIRPSLEEGEAPACSICLSGFGTQEIGNPDTCNHEFCLECIIKWSQERNVCPVDRQEFCSVRVLVNGVHDRSISVKRPSIWSLATDIRDLLLPSSSNVALSDNRGLDGEAIDRELDEAVTFLDFLIDSYENDDIDEDLITSRGEEGTVSTPVRGNYHRIRKPSTVRPLRTLSLWSRRRRHSQRNTGPGGDIKRKRRNSGIDVQNADFEVKEAAKSKGNRNKGSNEGSYNPRDYSGFNIPPPPEPVEAPSFSDFLMSSSEDFDNNGDLFANNPPPPPPPPPRLGSFQRPGAEEEEESEQNKDDSVNLYGAIEMAETDHADLLAGETSKSDEEARGMMEMLGHLYVDEDEDAQPGAAAAAAPILDLPPPLPPPPLPPLHEGLLLNLPEEKAADTPLPKPPDPPKLLMLQEPPRPPDMLSRIIEDCKPKSTGEEIYEPDSPTEEDDEVQPKTIATVLIPEPEEEQQKEETTYGPSLPPKGLPFTIDSPPPLPPLPSTVSAPELVDDSSEDVPLILKDTAPNRPITVEDSDNDSDDLTVIENVPKEVEPGSPMSPDGSPGQIPLPSLDNVPIPEDDNTPAADGSGGSSSQKGNPEAPVKFSLNLRSSVRSICNPLASVENEARKARKIEKQAMDPVELAKSRAEMALAIANKFVAQQQAAEGRLHTLVLPPSASKDAKETKRSKRKHKEEEDKRLEKMSDNEEQEEEPSQQKETTEEEMPVVEEQDKPMEVVGTDNENDCENIPLPELPPQIEYGPELPAKDSEKSSPNSPEDITEIQAEEPEVNENVDIPISETVPESEDIQSPDASKEVESAPPVVKDLADLEGLGTEDISDTNEDDNVVLQGLGTEAISDSNENFSDASNMEEGELADPLPHLDKFGFMSHSQSKSGGLRSHVTGGDFEEGEIVEENRSKKKKRRSKRKDKAKDSSASPSRKGNDARSDDDAITELTEKTLTAGITDTGENVDSSWKKPSKINKDRNYRDPKQHGGHDRVEYSDDDLMEKRRDKKRDMERYDVRKVVKEKLRKDTDEFGRDVRRRSRSRYRSRSRSRSRRRRRYRSYSSSYTRNYSSSYSRSPSYSRSRDRGRKVKKRRVVKDKYRGGSRRSREKKKSRASPVRRRKQRSITPVKPKAKLKEKAKNKLKRLPVEPKKKKKKSKLEDKTKKKEKTKKKKARSPINSKEIFATDDNIYVSLTLDRPFGKENKENKASKKRKPKSKSPEKVTKKKQKRDTTPKPKPLSEKAQRRQKAINAVSKSKTPELPSQPHISMPVAGSPPWERRPSPATSRSSPAHSRSGSWSASHSRSRSRSAVRRNIERPGRGRRVYRRRMNPLNPVEVIDLALLPSDEERDDDVIIVENEMMGYMFNDEHGDLTNIPMPREGSDRESSASPNEPEIRNTIPWHVPVEPPVEPPVRFSLFSRPSTLQRIQNPLASPDRPHRGPHTPPEPDQADPNAAEAYDPFEPTKSPSQSPTNVSSGLGTELLPPPMPPPSLGLPSIHTNLFPIMQHEPTAPREPVSREPAPREKTPSSKIKIKRPSEKSRSPDRRDDRRSSDREIEYRRRHSPERERRRRERKRKSPEESESRRRHKVTPEREDRPEKERVERPNKSPARDELRIQKEVQVERIPAEVIPVVESRRTAEPEPPLICNIEDDDDVVEAEVVNVVSPKVTEQTGQDIEEIQEITPAKEPEENASQPVVVQEKDALSGSPEIQMVPVQPRSKSVKTAAPVAAAPTAPAPQMNGRAEEGSPYSPTAPQDTPTQKVTTAAQKEDLASALKNVQELMKVAKESIMQNLSRTNRSKPVSPPLSDGSAPSPVDSPPVVPRVAVTPKTAKVQRKPHSSPLAGDSPPSPDASFSPGSPPGTPPSPMESPDLNLPDDSSGAHPRQSLEDRFVSLFGSSGKGKRPSKPAAKPVKTPEKKKKAAPVEAKKGAAAKVLLIDEENLQVLDDVPSSAVELQVKSKFLKKLNRQERVVEEVKLALKPLYMKKTVDKTMYKDIMRKAVPKICHNKSGEINPKKVRTLVNGYVKKFKYQKEKDLKQQKARLGLG